MPDDKRMSDAIRQVISHLEMTREGPITEEDAYEYLEDECGMQEDGSCLLIGSEDCDFCPFYPC